VINRSKQLTRRDALRAAAGAGAMVAGLPSRSVVASDLNSKYIDAHSHIWTRDIQRYPLREGVTLDDLDPPSFTAEELLSTAMPENVGRVVLIAHNPFYGWDNSYMTDAAEQHGGRFRVVGAVDDAPPHPDRAMKELLAKNVTGFRITPWEREHEHWLFNSSMQLMWKTAAETGQAICCLIDPRNLPEVERMCREHPDTKVVIDHFARIGADGKMRETDLKNLTALARHENTHVKLSAYYALGKKQAPYDDLVPMIKRMLDVFGPPRLMWASDSPYQLTGENTYHDSISLVRDRIDFLSEGDRDWLLRKTAEKVYFFDV
jgi:predicted TIM-barrel fold metal-dependent hydrolase